MKPDRYIKTTILMHFLFILNIQAQDRVPQYRPNMPIQFGYKIIGKIDGNEGDEGNIDHFVDSSNNPLWFWYANKYYFRVYFREVMHSNPNSFDTALGDHKVVFKIKVYVASSHHKIQIGEFSEEVSYRTDHGYSYKTRKEETRFIPEPNTKDFSISGVDAKQRYFDELASSQEWKLVVQISSPVNISTSQDLLINWER